MLLPRAPGVVRFASEIPWNLKSARILRDPVVTALCDIAPWKVSERVRAARAVATPAPAIYRTGFMN